MPTAIQSEQAASLPGSDPLPVPCANQFPTDCDTLRGIVSGLDSLEKSWNDARSLIHARDRGYFTPDEEDAVRRILLSYRNYRLALYNLINPCLEYASVLHPRRKLELFMLGFAAALTLYSKSLRLIHTYERQPLVRAKLNEPDARFELPERFFEEVLAAYSSPRNYRRLLQAAIFWRHNKRLARTLGFLETADGKWLAEIIHQQRKHIRHRLLTVLGCRLRYDLRLFWETTLRPVRRTGYTLKSAIGTTFAGARTTLHYEPALTPNVLTELQPLLRPGDVLLVRAEQKLTAALLPGFWAHAAIYLGTNEHLHGLSLELPPPSSFHPALQPGANTPLVVEAIAPRVVINSLANSLYADHVLVLRPNLSERLLAEAISESFTHLGKRYDFDFDFNASTRVVCTELVYRAFHKRGSIEFHLTKRLGRFTLTGNDIAHYALDHFEHPSSPPFRPVALVMKKERTATFIPGDEILGTLMAIRHKQSGKEPAAHLLK